jgi:hypothetical protein
VGNRTEVEKGSRKNISLKDIERALQQLNIPTVELFGIGLYKLPGGIITNWQGVSLFDKEVLKEYII